MLIIDQKGWPKHLGKGLVDHSTGQIESFLKGQYIVSKKLALVVGIMDYYEINVSKYISREIKDREMSINMGMSFPSLLTYIFLDKRV